MFESTAEKITHRLCENRIIPKQDRELYTYGFNLGLTVVLNLLSTVLVGVIFGMVFESIAFLLAYIPLRSYAGGYHANTPLRCYFISLIIIALLLSVIKFEVFSVIGYGILLLAGALICILLAPVADKNKPLDETEQKVYRHRTYIILLVEICVAIITVFVYSKLFVVISMTVLTEGIMLVAGKLKNRILGLVG